MVVCLQGSHLVCFLLVKNWAWQKCYRPNTKPGAEDRTMALERVVGISGIPLRAASLRGGLTATPASASGEASRDKTQTQVEGFRSLIEQAARRYNVDGALLAAVV